MPRIYLPITPTKEDKISITGEKSRYLTSILRCKKGDELTVFDAKGNCLKTKILKADKREVTAEILDKFYSSVESPMNILLAQGLLKSQKMDLVIQKATELGVKQIIPLITERGLVKETGKVLRWRKIAEEASRQCGRSVIPVICEPVRFKIFFENLFFGLEVETAKQPLGKIKGFIFWEEGKISLKQAMNKISSSATHALTDSSFYLFIGPEGGFTRDEVLLAQEKGLIITSLGKRILRSETAAISAVTLVQFLLGDLG